MDKGLMVLQKILGHVGAALARPTASYGRSKQRPYDPICWMIKLCKTISPLSVCSTEMVALH